MTWCHKSLGLWRHTTLSSQDELEGSPDTTLQAMGICSGDTLWLLDASALQPDPGPQVPQPAEAAASKEDAVMQIDPVQQEPAAAMSPLDALAQLVHAALLDCGLLLTQVRAAVSQACGNILPDESLACT